MVVGSAQALIAVNGWLGQREDFLLPFQSLPRRQGALQHSYSPVFILSSSFHVSKTSVNSGRRHVFWRRCSGLHG